MNWSDGIKPEEGHVEGSSDRMTAELTAVGLQEPLCSGEAGNRYLVGLWSGYTLCCFKGAEHPNLAWAKELCLPFYIMIIARCDAYLAGK